MSPENKQRVVGVIVLVAVIALLVPFLFANGVRKKVSISDEIPIGTQKRQLITEQIQNIDNTNTNTATTAVAVNTAQPTSTLPQDQFEQPDIPLPMPTDINQMAEPTKQDTLPPLENKQIEPAKNAALPPLSEGNQTELQDSISQVSANSVASTEPPAAAAPITKTLKSKAAVIKTPKIKSKSIIKEYNTVKKISKNIKKGPWAVQVGSFSDQAHIKKLVDQLHSNGFTAYMQKITIGTRSLTRVFIGHEASKEKADSIAEQLEAAMQIKGRVIRN